MKESLGGSLVVKLSGSLVTGESVSSGPQPIPLDLNLFNSVWTESPPGTWTTANSNESAASSDTQVMPADGRLINKWTSAEDSSGVWICFKTTPAATQFYQCQ